MKPLDDKDEAMKRANAVLQSGELLCEVTAASILREAIAAEEAQSVEPAGIIIEAGGMMLELDFYKDLPAGTLLYTRPEPAKQPASDHPINCGSGHCSCVDDECQPAPADDRAALITAHRNVASWECNDRSIRDLATATANMLAADREYWREQAQEINRLTNTLSAEKSIYDASVRKNERLQEEIDKLKEQQVAVPQGFIAVVPMTNKEIMKNGDTLGLTNSVALWEAFELGVKCSEANHGIK